MTAANLKPDLDQRWHVDDSKVVEGSVLWSRDMSNPLKSPPKL